jgi:tetratricopeptide (TPR) repeat protein
LLYGLALLYADKTDPDVLQALWGRDFEVSPTLSDLAQRHDFVLTGTRRLHQDVRDTFRRYLLDDARRAERREANRRASEVLRCRADSCAANLSLVECLESEGWRSAATAYAWHRFWEGNDEGLDTICGLLPVAILLRREFAHELIGIATFFDETFTPEQGALLRGLTALLSFGGFLDAWLDRRSAAIGGASAVGKPEAGSKNEQDRHTALRALSERVAGCELLPAAPPHEALAALCIAKSTASADPEEATAVLEKAAAGIGKEEGRLSAVVGEVAGGLTARLVAAETGAETSPTGLRAAKLRTQYESQNPSSWFGLGWAYLQLEMPEESLDAFQEVIDRFGHETDVHARRLVSCAFANKGLIYQVRKDEEGQHREFTALVEKFEGDDDRAVRREVGRGLFGLAVDLTERGESEQALEQYEEILEKFDREDEDQEIRRLLSRALTNKALARRGLGDLQGELDSYRELVERFGGSSDPELRRMVAQALLTLGIRHRQEKDLDQAVKDFDQQIEIGEDLPALREMAARAHVKRFEALTAMDSPEAPPAAQVKTEVERLLADVEAADAPVLEEQALFLGRWCQDPKAARVIFEKALEVARDEEANRCANFAQLLFEQGELEEGRTQAERAVSIVREGEEPAALEALFYLVALGPRDRTEGILADMRVLLEDGIRSPGWPLDRILARAEAEGTGELDRLQVLAGVIDGSRDLADLAGWDAWEQLGSREDEDPVATG